MKTFKLLKKLLLFMIVFISLLAINNNLYAYNDEWPADKVQYDTQPSYGSFAWRGNEYIMQDSSLKQALDNLGKKDTFDNNLIIYEYLQPGGKNSTNYLVYRQFAGWHSNVQCTHWYSNPSVNGHNGAQRWLGVIDFNQDGRHPTTGVVYYRKDNDISKEVESETIENEFASPLAYLCFYSGKDASENKSVYTYFDPTWGTVKHNLLFYQATNGDWVWEEDADTISHKGWLNEGIWWDGTWRDYCQLWANTWYNHYYDLMKFLESKKGSKIDLFLWCFGHNGTGKKAASSCINIEDSAIAYTNFANRIVDENGYADTIKSSVKELKQNGTTITGLKFDKFVADEGIFGESLYPKYNYNNTSESQGFADAGTDQAFSIKLIFNDNTELVETYKRDNTDKTKTTIKIYDKDGQEISDRKIKIYNDEGNEVQLQDIEHGKEYSISVSDTNEKAVTKVIVSSDYYLFKGRIFMVGALWSSGGETAQSRNTAGGSRVPIEDKIEFDVISDTENYPILGVKKVDTAGSALKGATFTATFEKDGETSDPTAGLKTNEAGEILIFSRDIVGLNIGDIYKDGGTLKITLKETDAPEGYNKLNKDIVIDAIFKDGKVTMTTSSEDASVTVDKIAYKNDSDEEKTLDIGVVTIKNTPENKIRIRKVDGDTDKQDYLEGAKFTVDVKANGTTKSTTQTVDSNGYIDITNIVNNAVGILGRYTGDIEVTLNELDNPNGFLKINQKVTAILTYKNGYLTKVTYPNGDNLSRDIIDVGESENRKDVTIVVKNTRNDLQPIYISKVDSQTGAMLSNVDFNVTISTSEITDSKERKAYKTSDDGIIAITEDTLKEVGLTDYYTGELYILMEEISAKAGYKKLDENVYIKVTYNNGNIESAEKISGPATCTIATNNSAKMLKVAVTNEWQIPELVISKESLSNYFTEIISANLNVTVKASSTGRSISKSGLVDKNGQIVFTSSELETLGIDGTYTGNLIVDITESSAEDDAVLLPESVTATLTLENGRYVSGSATNLAHVSIVNNNSSINVKVLNYKKIEYMPISGMVWEELATTKAKGTLIDGMYTTSSDSEYSDKLVEGIEVTLYRLEDNTLKFVNVDKGTNPTFTDASGRYEFQVPVGNGYIVKFTYNGEEYYSAPSEEYNALTEFEQWKLSSKASELIGSSSMTATRTYVNNLLSEIGSYPANYKMKQAIFASDKIKTTNNLRAAYAEGYNVAYRYDEIKDIYKEIATEMRGELAKTQNIDVNTAAGLSKLLSIYDKVAEKYSSDNEIYNKLQFIYDTRLDSYAGYNTNANGISSATDAKTYLYTGATSKDYKEQQYVNLGIVKRDKTDLSLLKDIYSATLSVNGHNATYNYNNGSSSYTQYLHEEDYNNNSNMAFYVTYKLTVSNSTNTETKLTEVVDYFDNRFGYQSTYNYSGLIKGVRAQKVATNGTVTDINNVNGYLGSKYIDASKIGLEGEDNYLPLYVQFTSGQEPSIVDGEKIEIYVTLKLGYDVNNLYRSLDTELTKNTIELFREGIDKLTNNNYAEINGYKTTKGVLDADSKPGTFKVKDYEDARQEYIDAYSNRRNDKSRFANALANLTTIREDDAWNVTLGFEKSNNPRTINGNVWNAISDVVRTSADLRGNNNILTYVDGNGIKGIAVELLELNAATGEQIVRARTTTNSNGEYTLSGFTPGDYVIRFVYGAETREGYTNEQIRDMAEASKVYNGQSYQSTKANPNTDNTKYWYAEDVDTRYSDAYDSVNIGTLASDTPIEYDYEGVIAMEENMDKTGYAYTSRIVIEIENTDIVNVDFGLTPRADNGGIDVSKYVSNIKIYLQDGTLQLNADIDEAGNVTYLNDEIYTNIVLVHKDTNAYKDGLIEALIDEQLLNGATLEVKYTVKVENNTEAGSYSLIYSVSKGTDPVAIVYYGEDYKSLPYYEKDTDTIMYHDENNEKYSLEKYSEQKDVVTESRTEIRDIVDYIDPNLTFIAVNKAGERVNNDWVLADAASFKSSRQLNSNVMSRYATIIRPTAESNLFGYMAKGESKSTTLTLSKVLSTSSTDTNDYEFSNLIEITKLYNSTGNMVQLQQYDITGEEARETSGNIDMNEIVNKDNIYPTLGTGKSETLVIHAPTGLNRVETILSNTVIVLIALVVLAGGIVLIKKFVLVSKN